MTKIPILLLCILSLHASAQTDSLKAIEEIKAFRKKLNEEYKDREKSPLETEELAKFEGHDFFPIDLDYRVKAKLTKAEGTPFFGMKTTTERVSMERIYGYINFTLDGKEFRLPVYQSQDLMKMEEYADYLFFPFTDETNGKQTYGGGRYIDLRIPKDRDNLVIDFNMAYNPYCAYSSGFSCPLVPAENQMHIEVPAGVRYHGKEKTETPDLTESDSEIFVTVETAPEYPGGYAEMVNFIKKNLKYPKAAVKKKIEGTVYVQFTVEKDGSISDVATIKGISAECDGEAERVVSLMPKWKPGKVDGKGVLVRMVLPINFKAPR
jgi:uncharacterized protein